MKYLRKFDSHEAFTSKYTEIKDQEYCISAVQDMCGKNDTEEPEVRVYFKDSNFNAWAGDLLCWDTSAKKWVIQNVEHNVDTALTLPSNLVPDAICVVPACHTEDGKARWCALNDVKNDALAEDANADKHYFLWGATSAQQSTLIDELGCGNYGPRLKLEIDDDTCRTLLNEVGSFSNSENSNYIGRIPFEYGPLDDLNLYGFIEWGIDNAERCTLKGYDNSNIWCDLHGAGFTDDNTIDIETRSTSSAYCPRQYGPDNFSKNPLSFKVNTDALESSLNALCDLSGFENTQILLKLSPTGTEYPAALAASLYEQTYSPAGTWYLPAGGELGYLVAKWYTIQHTLYRLQQGSYSASPLDCDNDYWSSTQCSADNAVYLNTGNGYLYWYSKYSGNYVRPFRSF